MQNIRKAGWTIVLASLSLLLLAGCNNGSGSGNSSSSGGSSSSSGASSGGSSSSSSGGSSSSGASGAAAVPYYIAYTATPVSSGASSSGGTTGLYVVPSNALGSTPVQVTSAASTIWGVVERQNVDNVGYVTGYTPYGIIYATSGAPGGDHFYALSLDATKAPAPVQVSSAALPPTLCNAETIGTNLREAGNDVLIYATPGSDGQCGTADDQASLVHYTDSATTAPAPLTLDARTFENGVMAAVYDTNGVLGGIAGVDLNLDLNYYPAGNPAQPMSLLHSMQSVRPSYIGPGYTLIEATSAQGSIVLYKLDSTGHLSAPLIQFSGTPSPSSVVSGGDVYFTDTYATAFANGKPTSYAFGIVKTKLDGSGTAQGVYGSTSSTSFKPRVRVEGFIGSRAVVSYQGGNNSVLYTLDTSTSGAPLQSILNATTSDFEFIIPVADNHIFASYLTFGTGFQYTTLVLGVDGTVLKRFDNTDLVGANYQYSGTGPFFRTLNQRITAVYLAQGITSTNGTDGGATLTRLAPDTLTTTPVADGASGQPYVLAPDQNFIELYIDGTTANGTTSQSNTQDDAMGFDGVNNILYRFTNTPDTNEETAFY